MVVDAGRESSVVPEQRKYQYCYNITCCRLCVYVCVCKSLAAAPAIYASHSGIYGSRARNIVFDNLAHVHSDTAADAKHHVFGLFKRFIIPDARQ